MLIAVIMIIMNIIIDRMMISSMTLNCVSGANIDQSSCECPDGFDEYEPEFRSHGLHKLCRGPDGAKRRSICKCSDGTLADWTKHPCKGNAHLKSCTCWA